MIESLTRVLRVAPTLEERLELQPSLFASARMPLSRVHRAADGTLQLFVTECDQPVVMIDAGRGDYIFKIDSDYYFSADDTEGRIVRVSGH